jgi:chromosomal replication initiator protein
MSALLDMVIAETERTTTAYGQNIQRSYVRTIQEAICGREGIQLADMLSARRSARIAMARHIAMWLVRQLTPLSYPAMGRYFHNGVSPRDHTSIMHGVARIDNMMVIDPAFHEEMQALRSALSIGRPT